MTRSVVDQVLVDDDGPRLVGAQCSTCETTTFPAPSGCPRCTSTTLERVLLPTTGRLWTWTVQGFRPKAPYRGPEPFEPYGVGYVEFPGQCIVEGRLTTTDLDQLVIGRPMRLTTVVFAVDDDGTDLTTFAFEPSEEAA